MTASSPASGTGNTITSNNGIKQQSRLQQTNQYHTLPNQNSSATFQQIKQTQASLARLYRVQQLNNQQHPANNNNQPSHLNNQQHQAKPATSTEQASSSSSSSSSSNQLQKPTTFVDCLIRRFKNCFSEDFCTVPMFVVGNLSPGSDGTHLILPPCISLGRQNINRFSSPKNLRLMNSIRESCRPIEELDLGGNKLNDLIEVYKILQCTPNLKFLNLSENDLSRTSPVAMASSSTSISSSPANNSGSNSTYALQSSSGGGGGGNVIATSSSLATTTNTSHSSLANLSASNQRAYLAPINQNHQHHQPTLGTRRHHSTLGAGSASSAAPLSSGGNNGTTNTISRYHNTSSSNSVMTTAAAATAASSQSPSTLTVRVRPGASRVAEARRLAAANALAQTRKTSSSLASKLTNTATEAAGAGSSRRLASVGHIRGSSGSGANSSGVAVPGAQASDKRALINCSRLSTGQLLHQRQAAPTSTMCLARSLSSLSAKDVRAAASINRYANYRSGARKDPNSSHLHINQRADRRSSIGTLKSATVGSSLNQQTDFNDLANNQHQRRHQQDVSAANDSIAANQQDVNPLRLTTSLSHQKLFVEPIAETDDVDMAEQQLSPNYSEPTTAIGNNSATAPVNVATAIAVASAPTTTSNPSTKSLIGGTQATGNSTLVNNFTISNSNNISRSSLAAGSQLSASNNQHTVNITFRRTFESIKALALNNTGCQWRVVCSILSRMPNLEELHLSLNNYEKIDLDPCEFKHHSLKRLYLCNNPKLTNWEELDKILIAFPSLEALSIANCNISQIPDNLDRAREWRKLCGLNINGWPIKEWPVVERLNQLPSLIDLKCRNLEVLNTIDEPRHHLIARLPKLQRLNGSEIEEREDAEKAFLRFFMANSHLERPSRFHELIQIHGEVVRPVDVDVDLSPPTHAQVRVIYLNRNYYRKENEDDVIMSEDFLIKLMETPPPIDMNHQHDSANNTVVQQSDGCQSDNETTIRGSAQEKMDIVDASSSGQPTSSTNIIVQTSAIATRQPNDGNKDEPTRLFKDDGQEVVGLSVDLRQSVRKFKSTISNIFGLSGQRLILYYIDHEMVGLMGPELIKHNQKKLWNYNVQDGDQFIVEER